MTDVNDSENFEPFWFTPLHYQIPEAERVEGAPEFKEGAPRYKLKPLDGIETADYIGRINANERGMYVFHSGVVASLMLGFCSEWKGVKFKGEPLAYDLKSLGKVPGHDLHACAGAIIDRSYFAEDDLKN
jgi:hypothetical protein